MSQDPLDRLAELMERSTPAPWRWKRMGTPTPILIGDHAMRPIVLAASRKGMQGACITMRNEKLDIMLEASEEHPDAMLIETLRNSAEALVAIARAAREVERYGDTSSGDDAKRELRRALARLTPTQPQGESR